MLINCKNFFILFLSRQHYDLTKKIMNCLDANKRLEYELKAECLNKKMKAKAKQINKLKVLQHRLNNKKVFAESTFELSVVKKKNLIERLF